MNRIIKDLDMLNKEAKMLAMSGKVEDAMGVFKGILHIDPNYFEANFNLAVLFTQKKEMSDALFHYRNCLKTKPLFRDVVINMIYLLAEKKEFTEAVELLDSFMLKNKDDSEMKSLYGLFSRDMDKVQNGNTKSQNEISTTTSRSVDADEKKFKILFVQNSPCIRNYKMAKALGERGHTVSLAYTEKKLSENYKYLDDDVYFENIKIGSYRELWDLSNDYDLIHCHNLFYFEGVANRGARGRVYTTAYQMEEARRLYGIDVEKSLVFHNYTSADHLPKRFLPKLSKKDGCVHVVYEGGIGRNLHRNFENLLIDIAAKGIHIHIYPGVYYPEYAELFKKHVNVHYYQPISPKKIMEEMTKYDFGIIPWNITNDNKRFLDSTIANKLFEYLAAGLPVVTSPVQSYVDYFAKNKVGVTFSDAEDFVAKIPLLKKYQQTIDFKNQIFTYENEINRLEKFYYQMLL